MNEKQNYKENKELRAKLIDTEIKLSHISGELNNIDQAIKKGIDQIVETYVTNTLRSMNVDELSNVCFWTVKISCKPHIYCI